MHAQACLRCKFTLCSPLKRTSTRCRLPFPPCLVPRRRGNTRKPSQHRIFISCFSVPSSSHMGVLRKQALRGKKSSIDWSYLHSIWVDLISVYSSLYISDSVAPLFLFCRQFITLIYQEALVIFYQFTPHIRLWVKLAAFCLCMRSTLPPTHALQSQVVDVRQDLIVQDPPFLLDWDCTGLDSII